MMYRTMVAGLALALIGCGASAPEGASEPMSESMWTAAELDKLEPTLRTRVRRGEDDRVAVRVYFLELPTDDELADLMLNRMGEHAIGQIEPDALHRLAARRDVAHIEPIRDVGYPAP